MATSADRGPFARPASHDASEHDASAPDWARVAPLLDEAVASLGESARSALVLRFFENKSYKEVAERLAIAEPAARQRVSRAVEQLRSFFARRSVQVSAAGLESMVIAHAVSPAPGALAGAASAAAAFVHGAGAVAAKGAAAKVAGAKVAGAKGVVAKAVAPSARVAHLARGASLALTPPAFKLGLAACVVVVVGAGAIAGREAVRRHGANVAKSRPVAPPVVAPVSESARSLRGRVLDGAGRPVEGAEVMLARVARPVSVYGPQGEGVLSVTTGADGAFEFPPQPDATAVVVRADAGYAQVRVADLPSGGDVTLTPWGRIEGTLKIHGKPAAGKTVELSRANGSLEEWNAWRVRHETRTRTDVEGRFVFPRVIASRPDAPGKVAVRAGDRRATARVGPGQTVRVDIGNPGRAVVGRLVVQKDDQTDSRKDDLPVFNGMIALRASAARPAATQRTQATTTPAAPTEPVIVAPPPMVVHADGTFRAEDVPPGDYTLYFRSRLTAAGAAFPDDLAWADVEVTVPAPSSASSASSAAGGTAGGAAGGTSEVPPIDLGAVPAHLNKLLMPGDLAPDFTAAAAAGGTVRLTDFRGQYLLVYFSYPGAESPTLSSESLFPVYDRFHDAPGFRMLEVRMDGAADGGREYRQQRGLPWPVASASAGGPVGPLAALLGWPGVPPLYLASATRIYLIGPEGKVSARNLDARTALAALSDSLPRPAPPSTASGPRVTVEHHAPRDSTPGAPFAAVPGPTAEGNVARSASFSIVDGEKDQWSAPINVLNDGRLPRAADDPGSNFFFAPGSLEGRFKLDLGRPTSVKRINTWSWHKGHRAPQVYTVYGSDGSAAHFNPTPTNGTDPVRCGWTKIADVDTRPGAGASTSSRSPESDGGQYAVGIQDPAGPLGSFRYLLFAAFVTETADGSGHTFFSEVDVIAADDKGTK